MSTAPHAHAGGHRRRRSSRTDARPPPPARGHRHGDPRRPEPRLRGGAHPGWGPGAGDRRPSRGGRRRRAAPARGARPPRDRAAVRGRAPPDPAERARGRAFDRDLRPDRARQGLDRPAARDGSPAPLRGRGCLGARPRDRASGDPVPARGPPRGARVRRDRGLRRVPRDLPPEHPVRCPVRVLARVPVRLARDPRGGRPLERRARLRPPRARVRAPQPPLAGAQPPLPPVPTRRGPGRVAGRPHLGGAADAGGRGGMDARRGTDPRERRHGHAELRLRADALRTALPRRRRGSHRAAHRRQGAESRAPRRARARSGARRPGVARETRAASTSTRTPACGASGGPSTSRGG